MKTLTKESKILFLRKFTRELIFVAQSNETRILQDIAQRTIRNKLREHDIKNIIQIQQVVTKREISPIKIIPKVQPKKFIRQQTRPMNSSYQPLPPTVQYIKPIPTQEEIDLEKINQLIRDPAVKVIECDGQESPIMVKGDMGSKPTSIILTKNEINEIINKFSEKTRIPAQEGIFKVVYGRLIFSAIISEEINTRFIIEKMNTQQSQFNNQKIF